jgi:DNA-binding NtrC family response regulator
VQQKILAVDDQPHMLVLIERIIKERTPYSIVTTNNPLEVPKMLANENFDLIVSDLKMPGMDGLEILDFVHKNKRNEKVIIITAFGELETAIQAMQRGAFDYITKPFKKEQIMYTIDRAMTWQNMVKESDKLLYLLAISPYDEAETEFKKVYLKKMAKIFDNQIKKISEKSGLPETVVKQFLQENSQN